MVINQLGESILTTKFAKLQSILSILPRLEYANSDNSDRMNIDRNTIINLELINNTKT